MATGAIGKSAVEVHERFFDEANGRGTPPEKGPLCGHDVGTIGKRTFLPV